MTNPMIAQPDQTGNGTWQVYDTDHGNVLLDRVSYERARDFAAMWDENREDTLSTTPQVIWRTS